LDFSILASLSKEVFDIQGCSNSVAEPLVELVDTSEIQLGLVGTDGLFPRLCPGLLVLVQVVVVEYALLGQRASKEIGCDLQ
jgi:hypothetical protein